MNEKQSVKVELTVYGKVQGVGYRDHVSDVADELDVVGKVSNITEGKDKGAVHIVAEGKREEIERFIKEINIRRLSKEQRKEYMKNGEIISPQPLAKVDRIEGKDDVKEIDELEFKTFEKITSESIERETLNAIRTASHSMKGLRDDIYHDFYVLDEKYGNISEMATTVHNDFRLLIYVLIAFGIAIITLIIVNL